jgi:NitT/TauT family transport system ATP-binding protein
MTQAARTNAPARVVLDELTKTFGSGRANEVPAVDRVSFEVRQGEFVALIGPSGCGKSTILNMIAGLIPVSDGRIRIDGHEVAFGRPTPKTGYVFQRDTVFPWRTVRRNIGLGLELAGRPRAERDAEVARMVGRAGLEGFENAFPITLSGGMRQRVSLMRTLIMRPEILLMDEPFGALDTHTKLEMHKFLLELWDEEKQTVLFVTHDLGEALTLSDRVVVLSARPGRIKDIFEVPFARPRDAVTLRETADYSALFSRVWHSLGEEFRKTRAEG